MSFGDQCVGLSLKGGPQAFFFRRSAGDAATPVEGLMSTGACRRPFLSRRVTTHLSNSSPHRSSGRILQAPLFLVLLVWVGFAAGCVCRKLTTQQRRWAEIWAFLSSSGAAADHRGTDKRLRTERAALETGARKAGGRGECE